MKIKILLALSLFFTLINFTAKPQTRPEEKSPVLIEANPESVGVSSFRLSKIDSMCVKAIKKGDLPGVVTFVARKGKIIHWKAFGMADIQSGRTLKRDDIFRFASQTKAITATAVLLLWEDGRFKLDDPISKYIPEFKNPRVLNTFQYSDTSYTTQAAKGEITIRQLLTHTSGIGYGIIDKDERMKMIYRKAGITDAFTEKNINLGENIRKLASLPLHHNPGERYTYSEGLDVLGYLIEIISGLPLDQFLKTHIFDPLGMNDTRFYYPEKISPRLVDIHQPNGLGGWEKAPATWFNPNYPVQGAKTYFSGGGGLCGTAKDYAIFLQMYLNGGEYDGVRLLSRTTVDFMMDNQIGNLWGEKPDKVYGLAFAVITPEGKAKGGIGNVGTFEGGGIFYTHYFADPKEKVIGIILKQLQGKVRDDTSLQFRMYVGQSIND